MTPTSYREGIKYRRRQKGIGEGKKVDADTARLKLQWHPIPREKAKIIGESKKG
jgi:hypothetical protein